MFAANQSYLIDFYVGLNQIFIEDEMLSINHLTRKIGESTRSLNRHLREKTGFTPMQVINAIRFYSAFLLLQNGETIDNTMDIIKIESISYFTKKCKKYLKTSPSKLRYVNFEKPTFSIDFENCKYFSNLKCDIKKYHYYCENLNPEIAELLSHYDFKDITDQTIDLRQMKDIIWEYGYIQRVYGDLFN
jgi:AraC-like DNA-binding protein